jgi:hypothetical protein
VDLASVKKTAVRNAAHELTKIPTDDRSLLIKVLEDEEAFNYRLRPNAFLLDPFSNHETEASTAFSVKLCDFPTKPAMCVIGALVAAKLPSDVLGGVVVAAAKSYAAKFDIDFAVLDHAIRCEVIPELIEELRKLP